jgi:hypothetical protein
MGLSGCAPAEPAPPPSAAPSSSSVPVDEPVDSFSFAVIGDVPYGSADTAAFPRRVQDINQDEGLAFVVHLGDIKDSESPCTDEYFETIRGYFEDFTRPLVYTPGDNEWTGCHQREAGEYNPLERLSAVRRIFFSEDRAPLARRLAERSQAGRGLPENVLFSLSSTSFATLHLVGSGNGTAPWTGLGLTVQTQEQAAEVVDRTAAAVQMIGAVFEQAREKGDRSVVLFSQADMFPPGTPNPGLAAFQPVVQALAAEAAAFDGPVYLFNGDTHIYVADNPLDAGSPWPAFYGLSTPTPQIHRMTVTGGEGVRSWTKVRVFPSWSSGEGEVAVAWLTVPYSG